MSQASILTLTNSPSPSHLYRQWPYEGDYAAITAADTVLDLHQIPY